MDAETLARALEFVARGGAKEEAHTIIKPAVQPAPIAKRPVEDTHKITPVNVAAALCRKFEGLYLTPYLCPAGIPTIGFGATYYEDGTSVKLSDPAITKEYAESLLIYMVKTRYLPSVMQLCPNIDTAERAAAVIDFTYNLGAGKLKASTLRKRINEGNWDAVPTELRKWVIGGGKPLKGLIKRREAEISLL